MIKALDGATTGISADVWHIDVGRIECAVNRSIEIVEIESCQDSICIVISLIIHSQLKTAAFNISFKNDVFCKAVQNLLLNFIELIG